MNRRLARRGAAVLAGVLLLAGCKQAWYEVSPALFAASSWLIPAEADGDVSFVGADEAPEPPSGIGSARLSAGPGERAELRDSVISGLPLRDDASAELWMYVPAEGGLRPRVELHVEFTESTDTDLLTLEPDPEMPRDSWVKQGLAELIFDWDTFTFVPNPSLVWTSERCGPVLLVAAYCDGLPGAATVAAEGLRIVVDGSDSGGRAYVDAVLLPDASGDDRSYDFEPEPVTRRVTDATYTNQGWVDVVTGVRFAEASDGPLGDSALHFPLLRRAGDGGEPPGPVEAFETSAVVVPGLSGIELSRLHVLRYWSWRSPSGTCQSAFVQVKLDIAGRTERAYFWPCDQVNQNDVAYSDPPLDNTWQHWVADQGLWWTTFADDPSYGIRGVFYDSERELPEGSDEVVRIIDVRMGVAGSVLDEPVAEEDLPRLLVDGLTVGLLGENVSTTYDFGTAVTAPAAAATADAPLQVGVTSPFGGPVTARAVPTVTPHPDGFELLGSELDIDAPPATAALPLRLDLSVHASALRVDPAGGYVVPTLFRDGMQVPACAPGAAGADPDPCIAGVTPPGADRVLTLTVLTSRASTWSLGYVPRPPAAEDLPPVRPPTPTPQACPDGAVPPAGFGDVAADNVHAGSIDCVVWWQLGRGLTPSRFGPDLAVTRGQMATFVAGSLRLAGVELPAGGTLPGEDGVHAGNAAALLDAGVLAGREDGTFGLDAPVTRAQMATFLVAAYERALTPLAPGEPAFSDTGSSVHAANIDKAAGAGLALGVNGDVYDPDSSVRRDQMASFLVRLVDAFVAADAAVPPAAQAGP